MSAASSRGHHQPPPTHNREHWIVHDQPSGRHTRIPRRLMVQPSGVTTWVTSGIEGVVTVGSTEVLTIGLLVDGTLVGVAGGLVGTGVVSFV